MSGSNTKLMGLLGSRISYSKSPTIHNFAAAQLGIDISYINLDMGARHVASFLENAFEFGAIGFNVTQPHKKLVAELTNSEFAAVNTLVRGKDYWEGHCTDILGLEKAIQKFNCDLKSFEKIVVFGGGGVCFALIDHIGRYFDTGPEVVVCRRSAHRDAEMQKLVSDKFKLRFVDLSVDQARKELEGRAGETLWLQASSAPLQGNDLAEYVQIIPHFDGVFIDAVYGNPSAMYYAAKARGRLCQDGLPMLIEQARSAQILWWGKSVAYEILEDLLMNKISPS